MRFNENLVLIGVETKISQKTGKSYNILKAADSEDNVFEFFLSDGEIVEKAKGLKKWVPFAATLEVRSVQGNTRIDIVNVAPNVKL